MKANFHGEQQEGKGREAEGREGVETRDMC